MYAVLEIREYTDVCYFVLSWWHCMHALNILEGA